MQHQPPQFEKTARQQPIELDRQGAAGLDLGSRLPCWGCRIDLVSFSDAQYKPVRSGPEAVSIPCRHLGPPSDGVPNVLMSATLPFVFPSLPMPRPLACLMLAATSLLGGCINQWNTRFPRLHYESAELQQREALLQDPFPDDSLGPPTGFRPPGYETPRTDPLRTRQHSNSTILKQRYGPPPGPQVGPGAMYPNAVRVE